jgi:hypothetical protein
MKYLLDTNVLREIGKTDPDEKVAAWLNSVDDADLAISTLTIREVSKGIAKLRAKKPDAAAAIEKRMAATFAAFAERTLAVSREVAELWGQLLAEREVHIDDTGLAATAHVHRLILVTRNIKHVAGRGVPTLDPFKAQPKVNRPSRPGEAEDVQVPSCDGFKPVSMRPTANAKTKPDAVAMTAPRGPKPDRKNMPRFKANAAFHETVLVVGLSAI